MVRFELKIAVALLVAEEKAMQSPDSRLRLRRLAELLKTILGRAGMMVFPLSLLPRQMIIDEVNS